MQQHIIQYVHEDFPFKMFNVIETRFGEDSDYSVTEVVRGMPGQELRLSKVQFNNLVERMLENGWVVSNSSVD